MRYRNINTGIEFETSCIISGADFEPVGKNEAPKAEAKAEAPTEVKTAKPKTTTKRAKK